MTKNLRQDLIFPALQAALTQIKFWLSSSYPPQIMLATPTKEEFEVQKLPATCKVQRRKIRGPRVLVQKEQRQDTAFRSTLAYWPKDGLVEGTRSIAVIVLKGNPKLYFADYSVLCHPGDFIIAPSQIPRFGAEKPPYEKITEHSNFDLAVIFYGLSNPSMVSMRISYFRNGEHGPAKEGEACWVNDLSMGQILIGLQEYLEKGDTDNECAVSLLKAFGILLQRHIVDGNALNKLLPADSLHVIHQDPIEKALTYIQNHLDRPLSIDIVARWVGLSRSVFTRQFRTATRKTFVAYLSELRLKRAKVLLVETDLSVNRICEELNLSTGRLRQLFHEHLQSTPSQFRKKKRKVHK